MRLHEGQSRRLVESELYNPDTTWLAPLVVRSPSFASLIHPTSTARERRRLFRDRLDEQKANRDDVASRIKREYERYPRIAEGKPRFLLEPDIRELQFRDAIGAFLNERRTGIEEEISPLNVLVIGNGILDKHDTTLPYEIGDYSSEITFLGPLYDELTRTVCTNAFASKSGCRFTELSKQELSEQLTLPTPLNYDLILLYGGYSNPDLTSKQFSQFLLKSIKPDGRMIISAQASLDTLRDDIVRNAKTTDDFRLLSYPYTAFINLASDGIYVPSPRISPEIPSNRKVWSIGFEDIDSGYSVNQNEPIRYVSGRRLLLAGGALAASLVALTADTGHTAPFACNPTETTIYSNYTNSINTDFKLLDGKEIEVYINNDIVAVSLAPQSIYKIPRILLFTRNRRNYQLIASQDDVLVCAEKSKSSKK